MENKNFESNPFSKKEEKESINIDEYEREKIEYTIKDVERLAGTMREYLAMLDYCDEKNIIIEGRDMFDKIRYPDAIMGPENDINKLMSMFQKGQSGIAEKLSQEDLSEITRRGMERSKERKEARKAENILEEERKEE
jgi:hypothetical protein